MRPGSINKVGWNNSHSFNTPHQANKLNRYISEHRDVGIGCSGLECDQHCGFLQLISRALTPILQLVRAEGPENPSQFRDSGLFDTV